MNTTALTGESTSGLAGQRADARDVQADRFQQQQREEQVGLVPERQPGHAPAGARLGGGERQRADADVRVRAFGVGMGVVTVVLIDPPVVAQPDAEVTEQDAKDVAGPPGGEDLPVPGVVAQEAHLGEHHCQEHRHRQLPPRVAHHDEGGPSGGQQHDGGRDLPDVIPATPLQQPGLPYQPGQLSVFAAALRCRQRRDRSRVRPDHGSACSGRSHHGAPGMHIVAWLVTRRRS
jgi:hypothetical protein